MADIWEGVFTLKRAGTAKWSVLSEQTVFLSSHCCPWKCRMSAASPGQVIQHLLLQGPDPTKISLLCNQIIVTDSKGDIMPCVHSNMLHIFSIGMSIFSHGHTFLPSLFSYWFIISDSYHFNSYYSPLRTCFQSLL